MASRLDCARAALRHIPDAKEIRVIFSKETQFRYTKHEIIPKSKWIYPCRDSSKIQKQIYCWASQGMNCQGEWSSKIELRNENLDLIR